MGSKEIRAVKQRRVNVSLNNAAAMRDNQTALSSLVEIKWQSNELLKRKRDTHTVDQWNRLGRGITLTWYCSLWRRRFASAGGPRWKQEMTRLGYETNYLDEPAETSIIADHRNVKLREERKASESAREKLLVNTARYVGPFTVVFAGFCLHVDGRGKIFHLRSLEAKRCETWNIS